jgi:hypothetical protein
MLSALLTSCLTVAGVVFAVYLQRMSSGTVNTMYAMFCRTVYDGTLPSTLHLQVLTQRSDILPGFYGFTWSIDADSGIVP